MSSIAAVIPTLFTAACSARAISQKRQPIWLPHWPTCTVTISRGIFFFTHRLLLSAAAATTLQSHCSPAIELSTCTPNPCAYDELFYKYLLNYLEADFKSPGGAGSQPESLTGSAQLSACYAPPTSLFPLTTGRTTLVPHSTVVSQHMQAGEQQRKPPARPYQQQVQLEQPAPGGHLSDRSPGETV